MRAAVAIWPALARLVRILTTWPFCSRLSSGTSGSLTLAPTTGGQFRCGYGKQVHWRCSGRKLDDVPAREDVNLLLKTSDFIDRTNSSARRPGLAIPMSCRSQATSSMRRRSGCPLCSANVLRRRAPPCGALSAADLNLDRMDHPGRRRPCAGIGTCRPWVSRCNRRTHRSGCQRAWTTSSAP